MNYDPFYPSHFDNEINIPRKICIECNKEMEFRIDTYYFDCGYTEEFEDEDYWEENIYNE